MGSTDSGQRAEGLSSDVKPEMQARDHVSMGCWYLSTKIVPGFIPGFRLMPFTTDGEFFGFQARVLDGAAPRARFICDLPLHL